MKTVSLQKFCLKINNLFDILNSSPSQKVRMPFHQDLQSFLMCVKYYRRHIADANKLMKPLSQLTTRISIKWTLKCQESFEWIKQALIWPPILVTLIMSKKLLVFYVDALRTGAGACLKQIQDVELKIIAYASSLCPITNS